jgi:copper homeostasis protein
MPALLEVIVTSAAEAREAALGGADRLELVRDLATGGLTPAIDIARQVLDAVTIPVRTMVRESETLSVSGPEELARLQVSAADLARLPVDGLVLGFVRNAALDLDAIGAVLDTAPDCRATLHRAFEHVADPATALDEAGRLPQIDRVLVSAAAGDWAECTARLLALQQAASPRIRILVGVGLRAAMVSELTRCSDRFEFHAGRAAREPQTVTGVVSRKLVAELKALLL